MQTVETLNEGLKRAYTLKITAKDIEARVDAELKRVAPQIRMPGFRPGKVPTNLVRKMHGPAMMQEALNNSVQDGIQSLIVEHGLRPAMQPSIALAPDYELGQDAELTVELEVLPDVPTPQIEGLKLERLTVPVADDAVDAQLTRFAEQQKRYNDAAEGHAAAIGDLVVMDFVGKVDGVAFDGGTGEDMSVEIGSGRLIPRFEDQVIGAVKGEERQIAVTFPEDYAEKTLAGKAATFDLTIKDVRVAKEAVIDEELATSLGLESLE
ncbi:MAG: trigger factor, partial [Sphingomonas sp.]|nr:trigger factor [Sphingomonas sp.]